MEQVVRTQQVMVRASDRSRLGFEGVALWWVLAPVTERGEVIGLLEFLLPERPSAETVREIRSLAHMLAFVVIANRRHTDLYEWGQRTRPLEPVGGDPAPAAARTADLRGRGVHAGGVAGAGRRDRG